MMLKVVLCCFIAALAVVSALPSKRGACVVMCSPSLGVFENLGLPDCPDGTSCHSTGCGAMCVASKPHHCAQVMCDLYCPEGFLKDEHGCDQCHCGKSTH